MTAVLLAVVTLYRLIPAPVRRLWSFGKSTSHLAMADLRSGDYAGLAAVRVFAHYAVPRLGPPFDYWGMPPKSARSPVNWDN